MSTVARNLTIRSHFGADRHGTLSLPTLYVALFDGDPFGSGVEADTSGGYARVALANNSTTFGTFTGADVQATVAVDVVWPQATGLWSITDTTHWAILDNSTGGTVWYSGRVAGNIVPTGVGDVPRIPAGNLSIVAN